MVVNKLTTYARSPSFRKHWACLLWIGDFSLCLLIIHRIRYTEIDWIAYMQQIEQILQGQYDYTQIRGDTGPLVYPAGHVWIFKTLYYLTDNGSNILKGQYIFMAVYLLTLAIVLKIYVKAEVSPIFMALLILSKRIHSIYLLRLFNDCFTTLAAAASVALLQNAGSRSVNFSSSCSTKFLVCSAAILMSAAVSTKMSALLYLPGFGVVSWKLIGFVPTLGLSIPMGLVQLIAAAQFLRHSVKGYLSRAFELSRKFMYKWTVNWRFIPEQTFLSDQFSGSLLIMHVSILSTYVAKWMRIPKQRYQQDAALIPKIIALSNLIGILCARSLHYQFYSWFYWTIPLLLWTSKLPLGFKLVTWFFQEYAWNVYPSTNLSSGLVVASMALTIMTN